VIESGLDRPVGLTNAVDGSQRIFILEQPGRIRIIREETLSPIPFLDIAARVGSQGFEQGLLGLAFHPDFSLNGYFFVNYTDLVGDTVIARFQVTGKNIDQADPASELRILQVEQPYRNHNGGGLAFGPDGYLYIATGDGGSAGDPLNNAQSLDSLLGKMLRIDVYQGDLYGIPLDNPFINGTGLPEIWAYGLRNPWRFSFDRLSGDLYIGDVGQSRWEEINFLPADSSGGSNFGWRFFEGMHPYQDSPPAGVDFTSPVTEYAHDLGCSVTGGVVYRGERLPELQGIYLFGDYCSQRVWGLTRNAQGNWISSVLFEGIGTITSFGEDEAGEVYLVTHEGQLRILERP
jgi:glucose/arabinose dehydrogenase